MIKTRLNIAFCLIVTFQLFSNTLFAQGAYKSKEGVLSVTAIHLGKAVTAHSKEVEVSLDYETSGIIMTLDLSTLHTGIDSLDRKLRDLTVRFRFKGNLNLGRVATTTHAPQSFQFNGTLEIPQNRKVEVKGVGRLEHIAGGEELACELALYFDTDARDLGLHSIQELPGDQHLVKVQFFETVLRKIY